MNTLTKRILTSLFLLSFVMLGFFYTFILIILLILISVLSWIEFNGLIIKIFKDNSFKTKTFKSFVRVMTLIYLLIFSGIVFDVINQEQPNVKLNLLYLLFICICSDVGGYAFGKIFKWKKLTNISPKKTVSGVLGSFLFALLSVFIIQFIIEILYPSSYLLKDNFLKPEFFFLAIVFSLVSQAGDLTISYFKRLEKIKDVGKILPGHGGIFDRIDGLMFVVILTFILVKFNLF